MPVDLSTSSLKTLNMQEVSFYLSIPADEYLRIYQGSARHIQAISGEGRSVRFPANILQPFITREGVYGHFVIEFDSDNRFKNIYRQLI